MFPMPEGFKYVATKKTTEQPRSEIISNKTNYTVMRIKNQVIHPLCSSISSVSM